MNWFAALSILAAIVLVWCVIPSLWVLTLPGVPIEHRRAAALSFARASVRGVLMVPVDLLAPFIVPIALLGTRWESEQLPRWAHWWDNDVGLNGDNFPVWVADPNSSFGRPLPVPMEDTPEVRALCYWAKGHHPRSWWARFVWLGLRNRASAFAILLGQPADRSQPVQAWGDPLTSRERAGWYLREHIGVYQLFATRKLGPLALRTNYGHKVNFVPMHRPRMPVVCITASLLAWKKKTNIPAAV